MLTPIAPHTLTNRPVVLPATSALTIQPIIAGGEDIFVTADGQTGYPLSAADVVTSPAPSASCAWSARPSSPTSASCGKN